MTTDNSTTANPPAEIPRKRRHVFRWIVLGLLLVIIIAAGVVVMKLDGIVRSVVEKQSTASLNQQTTLKSAHVSLLGGKVSLNDLKITSPSGYQAPAMMSLGAIDVQASVGELRQDPIKVSSIAINNPEMVIEMQGTNFNIKKFIDSLPAGEEKPADASEPLKLVISSLNVNGAKVIFRPDTAALSALPGLDKAGLKSEYVLTIPPLSLKDIGTGEGSKNGAAIKEVITLLVTELANKATQSEQLPPELRQLLSLNVDQITEMAKAKVSAEVTKQLDKVRADIEKKLPGEAGQAIGDILKNPQGAATNPTKAIEEGLGGLLGGKKDQKQPPATKPK